uniref:Putative ovule protein n=1 Tax=Solanum chacoense TaxID=4108 RepID=A0A0V0HIH3_SOLCH
MAATTIDSYINVFLIWSWVVYKEANWITAILWAVFLVCFRSITLCGYILLQFLKLSTQESLQDPIYFVLLQRQKKTETKQLRKYSLLTARILSLALGSLMLGTLIYILVPYGSPFRRDAFTPWMSATLSDYFVIVIALSVWVAYKESSWLSAAFWIILIILFGSTILCAYIALQLFSLSSQDPVYLVLFSSNREEKEGIKEPLKQTA